MKPTQRTIESAVHRQIFGEGGIDRATQHVSVALGTKAFHVKIRFTGPMATSAGSESYSVRASSPEQAKGIVLRIAKEKGYKDVSVLGVEAIPGGSDNMPKTGNAVNPDPNAFVGLVLPTAVHRDLDTSQVILPPHVR